MYTYLSWLFVECSEWKCTLICLGFLCSVKSWNVHSFNFAVWKGKQVKIKTLLTWLIINWTKWKYTLFKLNFCCSVISEMASVFLLNTLAWKLSEQRGEERPGEFGPSLKCQWSDVVFTYFSTLKSDKISHFTYFFTWLHLSTSPLPAKWCDGREVIELKMFKSDIFSSFCGRLYFIIMIEYQCGIILSCFSWILFQLLPCFGLQLWLMLSFRRRIVFKLRIATPHDAVVSWTTVPSRRVAADASLWVVHVNHSFDVYFLYLLTCNSKLKQIYVYIHV